MAENYLKDNKIGFIGGGNMAQAIGFGILNKSLISPNNIYVSSRTEKTLNVWKNAKVNTTLKNQDIVNNCNIIFIAVKPQNLEDALNTIRNTGRRNDQLFISILVGISLNTLIEKLENSLYQKVKIVRSMPNTPMLLSEGITVYCSKNTSENDERIVEYLFSHLGLCEKISETLMNSAGALSGSGPAYAYMMIEALADGAVRKGIPRAIATKFAAQVLVGAGKMVLQTGKHPGQLKDEVCSPGGSTIAGVHAIENGAVRAALINAVEAATERSNALSNLK